MVGSVEVVALIHTYARDGELDPYMSALVKGFLAAGVNLHLIKTNDLVGELGRTQYKFNISDQKVVEYINSIRPAFVFTTNHGGITRDIMAQIQCPIVTWMVDHIPFLHHGGGHEDLFCDKDYVITSSRKNVSCLEKVYPVLKGRVHFLPFATNAKEFKKPAAEQNVNVAFVGTYFYCDAFLKMMEVYENQPKIRDGLLRLTKMVEDDYNLNFAQAVEVCGVRQVLKDFHLCVYEFKSLLSNIISLNNRIRVLDAISDLGLSLFGTSNWYMVSQSSLQLLRCFQFGTFIKTREQLVNLYQHSKISINVSHHQAVDGLPYRVFDIMASDSLLITNYREGSDLFHLFGQDMPVPMYRTPEELRQLVQYYLTHEKERLAIVKRCKQLVSDEFSFEKRVRQFFEIIGAKQPVGHGQLTRLDVNHLFGTHCILRLLENCIAYIIRSWPLRLLQGPARLGLKCFRAITTVQQRQRLKSWLRHRVSYKLAAELKRYFLSGHKEI